MKKKLLGIISVIAAIETLAWAAIGLKAPWVEGEKIRSYFASSLSQRCTIKASLHPHPYLGFAPASIGPCRYTTAVPLERQQAYYTVLFTGGSVAAQLAALKGKSADYFQEQLEKTWIAPAGKKFRVINQAVPGGAWPQSKIQVLLHASSVDAIVELGGYNETSGLVGSWLPGVPHALYYSTRTSSPEQAPRSFALRGVDLVAHSPVFRFLPSQILLAQILLQYARITQSPPDPWRTEVEHQFKVPAHWRREEILTKQLQRSLDFARDGEALCERHKILCLTFLQPIALRGKALTDQERVRVQSGSEAERADRYDELIKALQHEKSFIDASQIFNSERDTIYADPVHFLRPSPLAPARGDELLTTFILKHLGERAGWSKKSTHP